MGMTIDEAIKEIESITVVTDEKQALAFALAVHTMKKYQMFQANYEARLKADLKAILVELQLEIEEYKRDLSNKDITKDHEDFDHNNLIEVISGNIQQKINKLKEDKDAISISKKT